MSWDVWAAVCVGHRDHRSKFLELLQQEGLKFELEGHAVLVALILCELKSSSHLLLFFFSRYFAALASSHDVPHARNSTLSNTVVFERAPMETVYLHRGGISTRPEKPTRAS